MFKTVINHSKKILQSLDDESDYFRPLQYALVFGGIHFSSDNIHYRLFILYRIVITLMIVIVFDRIYVALFEWDSMVDTLGAVAFFTETVLIIFRAAAARYYQQDLQQVRSYLARGLNNQSNRTHERNRSYRIMRGITLWSLACLGVDQILLQMFKLSNTRLHGTPDNLTRIGPQWKRIFNYLNTCTYLIFSVLYVANLTVHSSYLIGIYNSWQDLNAEYAALFSRVDRKIELLDEERSAKLSDSEKVKQFWNILKHELNATVVHHSELLEQLDILKRFLNLTFLFMFYIHFQSLACGLLYCVFQGFSIDSALVGSYILVNLVEMFWIFKLVDDLNAANENISFSLYNLDWHQRLRYVSALNSDYRQVRVTLLMIMVKTQTKLGISCAGMFEISIEAFGELVTKMYNVLAFLLNIIN
ncbi:uncharacterized protein LOC129717875 [Wyeomyia smithii]|uniref:uncharacterized protein LOC129717875 n=1 Tax=Wyeomyia smithii TaxID=174621 RepID=UPI002467D96C|nr:uncharacterized protein LOC129717875 [Wyeomyia smithii]